MKSEKKGEIDDLRVVDSTRNRDREIAPTRAYGLHLRFHLRSDDGRFLLGLILVEVGNNDRYSLQRKRTGESGTC